MSTLQIQISYMILKMSFKKGKNNIKKFSLKVFNLNLGPHLISPNLSQILIGYMM